MKCFHCGTDNPENARFCGSCGSILQARSEDSIPQGADPADRSPSSNQESIEEGGQVSFALPPAPRQANRGWMVGTIVASAVAVLLLAASLVEYTAMRGDLTEARSDFADARQELSSTESDLANTRSELSDEQTHSTNLQSKLTDSRQALATTARCLREMFDAWFNTTFLSYASTGFALEDAVYSLVCRTPRVLYRQGSFSAI